MIVFDVVKKKTTPLYVYINRQEPPRLIARVALFTHSYTGHLECSLMMSLSKRNCGKMTQCSLRKIVFGRL